MSAVSPVSLRRYRRRILALGALAFVLVFAVGAAIFIPIVQNDLEDRVEAELLAHDIVGVTASFSGQDGTLVCAVPLGNPERALELAAGLWGVRAVSLDRTCHDDAAGSGDAVSPGDAVSSTTAIPTTTEAPPATEPGLDSLAEVVTGDPLFGQLAGLVEVADLAGEDGIGGDGPFTMLAPTDAAFDAAFDELGADAFGALTSDSEFLRTLLLHHVTEGRIVSDDLVDGPLAMLDGTEVVVDVEGPTFTSGSSVARVDDPATQLDIEASNGVVHAIDALLVPPGLDLAQPATATATTTSAVYANGVLVLSGAAADEGQRTQLLAAAAGIDPANIVDDLTIDAGAVPSGADIDRLAVVIEAMPSNLVSGTASLQGADLSLEGVVLGVDARSALEQLGTRSRVDIVLSERPVADAGTAQALQDELNDFITTEPILFEAGSTELTGEANAVIEQIAARALRLDGVDIVVVGHTDTDGDADSNQLLSEGRARSVRQELVTLGLDGTALTAEGRGESQPVSAEDGTEDKAASRRVEFVVTAR